MFQNIVLSPTSIKQLNSLNKTKLIKVLYNLNTEIILTDTEDKILNEVNECIKLIDGPHKELIEAFLRGMNDNIRSQKHIVVKNREENEYANYQSEIKLAENDVWKIILSGCFDRKIGDELYRNYDIELSDLDNYLVPNHSSKIRAPHTLELRRNNKFNFRKWIEKYIRDAKKIIIKDAYMCKDKEYDDLSYILRSIDVETEVILVTLTDNARNLYNSVNDGINAMHKLKSLKSLNNLRKFDIRWVKDKANLKDRRLETDKFCVILGHALGSVDPKTNRVRRQFDMIVTELDNI